MLRRKLADGISAALTVSGVLMASTALAQSPASAPAGAQTSGFPVRPAAPRNAPNVLLIMTDDVGFGASSTFGGAIPTATFDALAKDGARFSAFHTTGVCSPSRASLLTGRNPHRVGMGYLPEMAVPQPGYNSVVPRSAATVARVLQMNGYMTALFGKYHIGPTWETVQGTPQDHGPNAMGFDYFYGFLGALTNPWQPVLFENQTPVKIDPGDRDYFLERDTADHAIDWLRQQKLHSPQRPFFAYYAPATLHAPLAAPADWIARFKGKFDGGWDRLRAEIFARQKRLGVIPANAALNPMAASTPKWDSLSSDEKRVAARHMEVYAAMLAYADHQIGRVVDELKHSGQFDNTLIIYIQGDNGGSHEGGSKGMFNYSLNSNGYPETLADNLARIDQMGGPTGPTAAPVGWTRATNTPFQWNKGMASHLGGTRNGMVVSWPGKVIDPKRIRYQFSHVNDIAPSILEAVGITPPERVDGVDQMSIDGTSLLYALKDPRAPERHKEQYFEIYGNMALYKDGWMLSSTPVSGDYYMTAPKDVTLNWELYDLTKDYSQSNDLAKGEPVKLAEMIARFDQVADANQVKPIMRDKQGRLVGVDRGIATERRARYTLFPGTTDYISSSFPDVMNKSWSVEAALSVPATGGDGMIVTQGGQFAGWGLMVLNGRPTFIYRLTDLDRAVIRIVGDRSITAGDHVVSLRFEADEDGKRGGGGSFTLLVDGKPAGRTRVEQTVPSTWVENSQVGFDAGSTLTSDYELPFKYPGRIDKVAIDTQAKQKPAAAP
ncbi:MAG TPA: arylsulfatase [Novosphingobium sp.]|nr:arylsulfatase [Novosphingobium sp.]